MTDEEADAESSLMATQTLSLAKGINKLIIGKRVDAGFAACMMVAIAIQRQYKVSAERVRALTEIAAGAINEAIKEE